MLRFCVKGVALAALSLIATQVSATNFLNHARLLSAVEDPSWFEHNIPLLDVPDSQIQQIYYYRWQSYKEHLVYTGAQYGWLASEFLYPAGYGAPYGGIVAAAGHHIMEGRWIRDQKFGDDLVNYWLAGPGQFSKPAEDGVNKDTYDWAHEYSFWAASSVWRRFLVTGDSDFAIGQLDNLVKQYRGWDNHFSNDHKLYWQAPVWDASELTAASYETSDPYHGGYGYRPTINAYQYGDARAISAIAALKGDSKLANEYKKRAESLQDEMQKQLWHSERKFFQHMQRDDNPSNALVTSREIMGFVPWMFNMPKTSDSVAFEQLTDPQGFAAEYGPTTTERRSKWFMHEAYDGCCRWDGPSWPFATAQTLTAVENLLHDYPRQSHISAADYFTLLKRYAATQYKNGEPHIAEAHDPDKDSWMYDGYNHSEDYNHSTFVDNVIAGLIGVRGQANSSLVVNPLTPSSWDHFALENVAYHGHTITILWDKDGSHYDQGKGLRVYVDDKLSESRDNLGPLTIDVGSAYRDNKFTKVNIAANGQKFPQGTTAFASYTSPVDDVWRGIDGIVWRTGIPENSRWTSYGSPNKTDYYGIDLRRSQAVDDVRLFFYDDGGGVRIPSSFDLQYWTGDNWTTVPGQKRDVTSPTSNAETKITFAKVVTSKLRVVAPNPGTGNGWGLSEFQVWTRAVFQLHNENSDKLMGVQGQSKRSGASVQQSSDDQSRHHLWQFEETAGGWFRIVNLNSGLPLTVRDHSTSTGAQIEQARDTGSDHQLWRVQSNKDGQFVILNKRSGLVLGVDGASTADGANIKQYENDGAKDHLWTLLAAVPAK